MDSPGSHVFLVLGVCDIYLSVQVDGFGLGYFVPIVRLSVMFYIF